MKKIFLLLAFTGIVGAASAISTVALTKGTVITLGGDDKKQEDKKKCEKKACCKTQSAQASSGCSAAKEAKAETKTCTHNAKTCAKAKEGTQASVNGKAEAVSVPAAVTDSK
jgi:hypothetical protein